MINFKAVIEAQGQFKGTNSAYYFTGNTLLRDASPTFWNYCTGHMNYFSRMYYVNGKYYIAWTKNHDTPNNLDSMICTFDGSIFSESGTARAGTDGDIDAHALANLIVDDNGYIYSARTQADAINNLIIARSDAPYDPSSFTTFQTFIGEGGHVYPYFVKIGTNIFLIVRGDSDALFAVYKKGLTDETFAAKYDIIQTNTDDDKSYKCVCRTETENKIGLAVMYRDTLVGTTRTYMRLGYVESIDGVTWYNAGHTWSKDVVTNGYITTAEYLTNCIIEYTDTTEDEHWFAFDGFLLNNVPYFLVEYGTASGTVYTIDLTEISVRYWSDDAWQKKVIPASITGMPLTRSYGEKQLYHLTHDGSKFLLFVLATDYLSIKKYSSTDLNTWTDHGEILRNQTYKYGLLGSCHNRFDLTRFGIDNGTDWANFLTYKY